MWYIRILNKQMYIIIRFHFNNRVFVEAYLIEISWYIIINNSMYIILIIITTIVGNNNNTNKTTNIKRINDIL